MSAARHPLNQSGGVGDLADASPEDRHFIESVEAWLSASDSPVVADLVTAMGISRGDLDRKSMSLFGCEARLLNQRRRRESRVDITDILRRETAKYVQLYGEAAEPFLLLPSTVSQAIVRRVDIVMRTYARFKTSNDLDFRSKVACYVFDNFRSYSVYSSENIDNQGEVTYDEIHLVVKYKAKKSREYLASFFWGGINDLTRRQKLDIIDEFARDNPGAPVSNLIDELFPAASVDVIGQSARSLPDTAPATWSESKLPGEAPPVFVKRIYGLWLGHGLDRPRIKRLDPKLYAAINNWVARPENTWPSDVDLPTREEQNRRTIEGLRDQATDGSVGRVLGEFTAREAARIRSAIQRRK